jgi:hypothetical protein
MQDAGRLAVGEEDADGLADHVTVSSDHEGVSQVVILS